MERFLMGQQGPHEKQLPSLRPRTLDEYIGQKKVVDNVRMMAKSAKIRQGPMDHLLLSGPPGLGKTSLAMILAHELGGQLHMSSGPAIGKKGDLAALLTHLSSGDIFFIDEIHRLPVSVEEVLYSVMEDFRLDIVVGHGPAARSMRLGVSPFSLIGATTKTGLISNPLRDRFVGQLHFDFYSPEDLSKIIAINAKRLNLALSPQAQDMMSRCSRGTPRIANRILRRVRDFALVAGQEEISPAHVEKSLELMEIDPLGLDRMDRKILSTINDHYGGGPVGIEALCATLCEDRSTIEDVFEPYLLKEGHLIRTPRGREISPKAQAHLSKWTSPR